MKRQVILKLIFTLINLSISIALGFIVPRFIGPDSYGDYSYILSTYTFLIQLFLFSLETGYIYFLSSKKYSLQDVNMFYFTFLGLVFMFLILISFISTNSSNGIQYLWGKIEKKDLLLLGLVLILLTTIQQRIVEYCDSTKQTIISEKVKLISRSLLLISIALLVFYELFNIYWFFNLLILSIIIYTTLIFNFIKFNISRFSLVPFRKIFIDFYVYLKPLFVFSLIASFYSYSGRFLLQQSYGSVEQGYYNFANQIALTPLLLVSSITTIYLSEITQFVKRKNILALKNIFTSHLFKIFSIHSISCFFLIVNTDQIIILTVGQEFLKSSIPLKILCLFSLFNTIGIFSSNLFYATKRNLLYSQINSLVMLFGIFFMLIIFYYGNLNSTNLALLITTIYFIRISIQLSLNLIFLEIDKFSFFKELILVSLIIYSLIKSINFLDLPILLNLLITGCVLFILNFVFNDYLNIKRLIFGKRQVFKSFNEAHNNHN